MNDNLDKKQELENAGTNTAHVAGKAAATYFGGALGNVAYDKISQTKLGQGIEQGVGKVIGNTPIVNQLNKKANDIGAVDAAGKAVDALGFKGMNGRTPKKINNTRGNIPQVNRNSNLGNNKINSNSNVPKALQNRENKNALNRLQNSYSNSIDEEEKHDESEDDYQDESTNKREMHESKKNILLMKRILPVLLPIAIIIFIVFFIIVLLSNPIATVASFFSFEFQNTDDEAHYFNKNDPEKLEEELAYNERLLEIIDEYRNNKNVLLDKYLLHSIVVYRYFSGNNSSDSENTSYINYKEAIKTLDEVANLMAIENSDGTYTTDSKEKGLVYNKLINSNFLKTYYKDYLKDDEFETRERLVDEIYYFMNYAKELLFGNTTSSFLSDTLAVYLQTCDVPYNKKINERGKLVFNNKNVNAGTSYPEYLSMTDYLKGVVMAEIGTTYMTEEYREGIKAFVVAATNVILGSFYVDFYPGVESIGFPTGDCRQVSCDPNFGCSYNKEEYSTTYTGVDRYNTQIPGWKDPLTISQQEYMNSILDEVFGEVMVKKGITTSTFTGGNDLTGASYYDRKANPNCGSRCLGQEDAMMDAKNGMTYTEILDKYYHSESYDIINIKEGLYIEISGNYNGTIQLNEEFHYYQADSPWGSQKLCGSGAISSNGCNITSAAIAISLLTNQRVTPTTLNNRHNEIKTCKASSRPQMIMDFIKLYGLTAKEVKKDDTTAVNDMLSRLATGNYVAIARLAPNSGRYSTKSGHYIAVVGVKTENGKTKILIWDPATSGKNRDNYWADLNDDILKYLRTSYSFILVGRD